MAPGGLELLIAFEDLASPASDDDFGNAVISIRLQDGLLAEPVLLG